MKKITAFFLVFVICFSLVTPSALAVPRNTALEQDLATDLKSLSLFKGVSDTDFDLDRAPTRLEALVMLIRVMGLEDKVQSGTWSHPFTDVPSWATNYVGYAYQKGLTKGISTTEYGTGSAGANTYLTFMLRALGYSDTNSSDFTWDNPYTLAKSLDILPDIVDTSSFLRADVVLISYSALPVDIKGTSQSLSAKLVADGVFTQQQYSSYYDATAINKAESNTVLSAEEIYAKCASSVFFIEVYNASGTAIASGSGFFIDSNGTAVTNFHVINGASSAKITVSDTDKVYNVTGVYDYSTSEDWAVLKIDSSGFSYLDIGNSSSVVGGASVYAIGSPLGLQNTITEGIISNVKRTEDGVNYIQASAAISSGSSGGALINKHGKVIGITSASYVEGQNLNLALPMTYLSDISTSSVTALSSIVGTSSGTTETANDGISIATSTECVGVAVGSKSTIFVRWVGGDDDDSIYWDSSNEGVATGAWGNWLSEDTLSFTVIGVSSGTATISLYTDDKHSCDIKVTVDTNSVYSRLKQYLKSNGTYNSEISGYQLSYSSADTTYYIIYAPNRESDLWLISSATVNGVELDTGIYLEDGNAAYYEISMTNPSLSGHGYLTKNGFTTKTLLSTVAFEGSPSYKAYFCDLCPSNIACLLAGADEILCDNSVPVTISDLGFTAFYQEMYT